MCSRNVRGRVKRKYRGPVRGTCNTCHETAIITEGGRVGCECNIEEDELVGELRVTPPEFLVDLTSHRFCASSRESLFKPLKSKETSSS